MGVIAAAQLDRRVQVGEAVQPLGACQDADDAGAGVDGLAGIGQRTGLRQLHDAIAGDAGVQSQVTPIRQ